jgi:hypothetical protein
VDLVTDARLAAASGLKQKLRLLSSAAAFNGASDARLGWPISAASTSEPSRLLQHRRMPDAH